MKISVIIPTYQRPERLLQTLMSLQQQTVQDFEIIVVDNAADPNIKKKIEKFDNQARTGVTYITHAIGGNSGARNRGVAESTGDVLIYTDDDVTFDPYWVEAYQRKFKEYPDMTAAGGCVKPVWEKPPPRWLVRYIGDKKVFHILALMEPEKRFALSPDGIFFSNNMAIPKYAFSLSGFHPEIFGTQTIGDGEAGLRADLMETGALIGYVPEATAYHHIPGSRMTVDYVRKWAWHHGGGQMYGRWHGRTRNSAVLLLEMMKIITSYSPYWIAECFVRHCRAPKAITLHFRASLGWCKLAYVQWMRKDRKVKTALEMKDFKPDGDWATPIFGSTSMPG